MDAYPADQQQPNFLIHTHTHIHLNTHVHIQADGNDRKHVEAYPQTQVFTVDLPAQIPRQYPFVSSHTMSESYSYSNTYTWDSADLGEDPTPVDIMQTPD